jgi:hypothetical protein
VNLQKSKKLHNPKKKVVSVVYITYINIFIINKAKILILFQKSYVKPIIFII